MGAPKYSFFHGLHWSKSDFRDLDFQLSTSTGIEVNLNDVFVDPKFNTLSYRGQVVLLYIRDQTNYMGYTSTYKFHLTNCSTINSSIEQGRFNRYVVSRNIDGKFAVSIRTSNGELESKEVGLRVCKNCLYAINYLNYRSNSHLLRNTIYEKFSIEKFLSLHHTAHLHTPLRNSDDPSGDTYTSDFHIISSSIKKSLSYVCQDCKKSFTGNRSHFLHVHHIDGVKSNNTPSNLRCVCIYCHTKYPRHQHLKNSISFKSYCQLYGY